jgi:hypothetical protein
MRCLKTFLGITMVASLINEDFNVYYDWEKYQINYPLIQQRLQELREHNYSVYLLNCIDQCLERDEFQRITLDQLIKEI